LALVIVDVAADDVNISSTLRMIGISSNIVTRASIFTEEAKASLALYILVTMTTKIYLVFGINPTMHFST
jgi:hypothetical protein